MDFGRGGLFVEQEEAEIKVLPGRSKMAGSLEWTLARARRRLETVLRRFRLGVNIIMIDRASPSLV